MTIRGNLVFVLVLLELEYNLNFYTVCLEIFINLILTRHLVNDFIISDTMVDGSSYNHSCFWYITSSSNNKKGIMTWHARLGHIGQEIMYRLTREAMLGRLTKVELPIC